MRLFGRNTVIERIRTNPRTIHKIYLQEGFGGTAYVRKKVTPFGIPVFVVPATKIQKIARNKNTQGVVADVDDFLYEPYADLLEKALEKKRTLVFFDQLKDPQNLGAIIRSLACLGKFSVVLPTHDSVAITETVLRVASGGDNYVPVAKVANLNNAIKAAKKEGFHIAGAVVKGGESLDDINLPYPLGLVIGSEQKGIRDVVRKNLDLELTISMFADTVSFNAAQAVAILCYEITRQQKAYKAKK